MQGPPEKRYNNFTQAEYLPFPAPEFLVPAARRSEYLTGHRIEFRQLSNGITIFGGVNVSENKLESSTKFRFPRGAYFDPEGKEGILHLLEHLVAWEPKLEADKTSNIIVNASTGPLDLIILVNGTANPTLPDYGVLPYLPRLISHLKGRLAFSDEDIKRERGVILKELRGKLGDYQYILDNYFNDFVFAENNPLRTNVGGSEDSLTAITRRDLFELGPRVIIPSGLVATTFSVGDSRITPLIVKTLEEHLANFPREGLSQPALDRRLLSNLNPDFKPGTIHVGYANSSLTDIKYIWHFKGNRYDLQTFTMQRLFTKIYKKMYEMVRKNEKSYESYVQSLQAGEEDVFFLLGIQTPLSSSGIDFAYQTLKEIYSEVLAGLGTAEINELVELTKRELIGEPMEDETRFEQTVDSLTQYGEIVDVDKVRQGFGRISTQIVEDQLNRIIAQPPATILVGKTF